MLLQLNCIIMNWEWSGEGDGGVDGTDINNDDGSNTTKHTFFGTFANQMDHDLDLQTCKSILLHITKVTCCTFCIC